MKLILFFNGGTCLPVLQSVKDERNIQQTIKRRTANWISHILRRICLLKHVVGGEIAGRSKGKMRKKG
jgi:hypothetical protein